MDYMSAKEAAKRWGISVRRVQNLCKDGRIPKAQRISNSWIIPSGSRRPKDLRKKQSVKKKKIEAVILPERKPPEIVDYEKLLQQDFRGMRYLNLNGRPFVEVVLQTLKECPKKVRRKYPLALLQMAFALTGIHCYRQLFQNTLQEIKDILKEYPCDPEEKDQLLGEYEVILSFADYPDFKKMIPHFQKAKILCRQTIRCIALTESLTMGGFPAIPAFERLGRDEEEQLSALAKILECLEAIADGLGQGLEPLWRADIAYYEGRMEEAKGLAFESLYISRSRGQDCVSMGALELLSHIAIHTDDVELWNQSLDELKTLAENESVCDVGKKIMYVIIRSELYNALDIPERVETWIKKGQICFTWMPDNMYVTAQYIHIAYLFHKGQYIQELAAVKTALPFAIENVPQVAYYMRLFGVAALCELDRKEEAREMFLGTMSMFSDQHQILNCGEFYWIMRELMEEYFDSHTWLKGQVGQLKKNYGYGLTKLNADICNRQLPRTITNREYEVAVEAARGKTNKEIARYLVISEHTVRTHLRSIFKKMAVEKRNELKKKLLDS
ncbi:ATP-dependent transcriptional regulator-like protein [Lachnospiraceae bacterium KM106-2]|nr:ATP-dependent transcriptional regulator-like protein [Lachnospiraceae bacterium KM106-2]